jgi:hypothetical protein
MKMKEQEYVQRFLFTNFFLQWSNHLKKNNVSFSETLTCIARGFALEVLGTNFNFISPEDNSAEKHLQLSIPFIEFRELNPSSTDEMISLLGPIYKEYQEDTYAQIQEKKKKAAEFTISNVLWPDFISSHPHYPDVQKEERSYIPAQVEKRVFFREANEMFRLNVILSPQHSVLEGRVNPIQVRRETSFTDRVGNFRCTEMDFHC